MKKNTSLLVAFLLTISLIGLFIYNNNSNKHNIKITVNDWKGVLAEVIEAQELKGSGQDGSWEFKVKNKWYTIHDYFSNVDDGLLVEVTSMSEDYQLKLYFGKTFIQNLNELHFDDGGLTGFNPNYSGTVNDFIVKSERRK